MSENENDGEQIGVWCLSCENPIVPPPLDGSSPVCTSCGPTRAVIVVECTEKHPAPKVSVSVSLRQAGKGKIYHEKAGPSFFMADQMWHEIKQIVDNKNDRYRKVVIDAEGHVVRDVAKKLSEHKGHGDDKSQPKAHP